MRDTHRMKEKLELSLDNRQLMSLLAGGLVLVGAVFIVGVMVGKRLGQDPAQGASPDVLSALDERSAKLEEVRADAALTFQDELTRQRAPEPVPAEPAVVVVQPAPGGEDAGSPKVALPSLPPAAPERKVLPGLAERPAERAVEVPVATRTQSADALKEALARASQRKVPDTSATGSFTLQLAASPTRSEAERFASNLREKGYAPYIVEAHVDGRGTFYRVRMGRFSTKEAAQRYLQDFKRETQLDAFVAAGN